MSMWMQILDARATEIPPDGRTAVDVYVDFSFSGEPVPDGTTVNFIIGKGELKQADSESEPEVKKWTLEEIKRSIVPIEGINLTSDSAKIKSMLIRAADGRLETRSVAKVSIKPISDVLFDNITIVAYVSYDKEGKVTTRLQPDSITVSVSNSGGVFLSAVERYDVDANAWTTIEPMSYGRSGLVLQEVGGKLYAIGGFAGTFMDIVEEYDESTNAWTKKTSMPTALAFSASAVYAGDIYIIGGMSFGRNGASSKCYKYTPGSDTWTTLPDLPQPMAFGTAQAVGDKIIVMFGASDISTQNGQQDKVNRFNLAVMEFDTVGGEWSVRKAYQASPTTTNILANAILGDASISVTLGTALPPYGVIVINDGMPSEESLIYVGYDSSSGVLSLITPLTQDHTAGEPVELVSLSENRIGCNSVISGSAINVFNGQSFLGYNSAETNIIRSTVCSYDFVTSDYTCSVTVSDTPRYKAALATIGSTSFIMGGSGELSQWLNSTEQYDGSIFTGGLAKMLFGRHDIGAAAIGNFIYVAGGGGSGHAPGWLQMQMSATPDDVRADGRQTSSIVISAKDASGDPPPDGTRVVVRGIIYVTASDAEKQAFTEGQQTAGATSVQSSTGASTTAVPPQKISILPVLFSSTELSFTNGIAATTLMARSEDPIKEVENLSNFVKSNESPVDQQQLKQDLGLPEKDEDKIFTFGEKRDLYSAAIEALVKDPFFFGSSDTDGLIISKSKEASGSDTVIPEADPVGVEGDGAFAFNPKPAKQGFSANVNYFSDIVSIPDVETLTDEPVSASDAKDIIDEVKQEIPFGASPHFDALVTAAAARVVDPPAPPLEPPTNILISTSDNEESFSTYTAADVVDEANGVAGSQLFPVFVTNFVVTDPVSLSARRQRTDVADLEEISSGTGGNSFSVVNASYIDFVIQRIKTSAPSSIGSCLIVGTHEISGYLSSINYVVSNMVAGNSATMRIFYSDDGYNFTELEEEIEPNVEFTISEPIKTSVVKYEIILRSKTFNSPVLTSVTLNYVEPNVQYLFTLPQTVSGQVAELASVINHRLPSGGTAEMGLYHGESFMFDRDYGNICQPTTKERGTIMVVNRSFDASNAELDTTDVLRTDDFLVYKSISGPWSQESTAIVYVNSVEVSPDSYIALPESGAIAFRKRMSERDVVTIEIQLPSTFRFGIKITNPSPTDGGLLDSFAYTWAASQDDGPIINRPPRAVNLFISPSPALAGGPMEAMYTFVDPDGDEEDTSQTLITWFRNGVPVPELANKKTISNSDFVAQRTDITQSYGIAKGQEWFFTVRPSDGSSFGPLATSAKIIISNIPPSATNAKLVSENSDPTNFNSSDSVTMSYKFRDADFADKSSNAVFTWFVNGVEAKSGNDDFIGPDEKDSSDRKLLFPGNSIRCEVIPSDGKDFGLPVSSDTITISGTAPTVEEVVVLPKNPSSLSNLRLSYKYIDVDNLDDASTIQWFKNGQRISELDNIRQITSTILTPGQEWYAVVTPKNQFASGTAVKSNVVNIEF